ncbi:MAG TPA: dihydrolipoyl dehydrogenase [Clostridiales bacterium]|nr:dihydrolipoyl dehydrogenase [Clostridiales bacterium]
MNTDITIIGSGPGGYVAAIRAAQLGADVVLIEKEKIGGVCLNCGCIPTKSLYRNALFVKDLKNSTHLCVDVDNFKINFQQMIKRKDNIVNRLAMGVKQLLKTNGVKVIHGIGSIIDKNKVLVNTGDGEKIINTNNIIIATGATTVIPPIKGLEGEGILTSTEMLSLTELPTEIAIIGGGVIGVEFASIFSTFGSKVTIIEKMANILPEMDNEVSEALKNELVKKGIAVNTRTELQEVKGEKDKLRLITTGGELVVDKVLVSVGRKPLLPDINSNVGINITSTGAIEVNSKMQTNVPNIYAIGDVNGNYQLAHVASAEGIVAANNIMGKEEEMDYKVVPNVVFSLPEVASVGLTESKARERTRIKVGTFPYSANGKALSMGEETGFIKVIADKYLNEILGVHIFGYDASNLIAEAALGMKLEVTADEVAKTIHAHPTVSEIMMEACQDIDSKAIHKI